MRCVTLVASFVALTISTAILLCRPQPLQTDWAAVLVAVLSVLVAALITWQVANYLSFERRIKARLEEVRQDAANTVKAIVSSAQCDAHAMQASLAADHGLYTDAVVHAWLFYKNAKDAKNIGGLYASVAKLCVTIFNESESRGQINERVVAYLFESLTDNLEDAKSVIELRDLLCAIYTPKKLADLLKPKEGEA